MSFIAASIMVLAAHIAAPAPLPPSRFGIVLDVDRGLPPAIQRPAAAEAARLWAPYRIDITLRTIPLGAPKPAGTILRVRLAGLAPRTMSSSSPFGSMQFVGGRPEPIVVLHYEAIARAFAGSGALGLREEQMPSALRDHMLGRIVGRVIAHEIGHFVLRSPRHASRGLMRPIQSVAELITGNGEIFGLTPEDLRLLRSAMTLQAAVEAGPEASGASAPAASGPRQLRP